MGLKIVSYQAEEKLNGPEIISSLRTLHLLSATRRMGPQDHIRIFAQGITGQNANGREMNEMFRELQVVPCA